MMVKADEGIPRTRSPDQAAQKPLGLAVFRPGIMCQGMGPFQDRRAAVLSLVQLDVGAVGLHQLFQLVDVGVAGIGVARVWVIGDVIDAIECVLLFQNLQNSSRELEIDTGQGKADDGRVRLDLLDRLGRSVISSVAYSSRLCPFGSFQISH